MGDEKIVMSWLITLVIDPETEWPIKDERLPAVSDEAAAIIVRSWLPTDVDHTREHVLTAIREHGMAELDDWLRHSEKEVDSLRRLRLELLSMGNKEC